MPKILIEEDEWTLKDISCKIANKYPHVKFLFEINFSKEDYLYIKNLFCQEKIKNAFFERGYLRDYFNENKGHRLPFLILIAGFIRYEYLNEENHKNFYKNFLKTLDNGNAQASDFFRELVDSFFKRSSKEEAEGLFIYEHKLEKASLPLESAGDLKYLNSLIFHSGGICEKYLGDYFKIIKKLSDKCKEFKYHELKPKELFCLYEEQDIRVYRTRLADFFELLSVDGEISNYINEFVLQSISIFLKDEYLYRFTLPLYIKNYLLFNGIYGDKIEDISVDETDFIYENENIYFNPNFSSIYKNINSIAFNMDGRTYIIPKEYD
ncbi:MAG: hypothetical protein LBP54_08680, partial [Campylobacteraceae bacterium]|nr:hypothetical protein [Campylobacteraceae bacterium]